MPHFEQALLNATANGLGPQMVRSFFLIKEERGHPKTEKENTERKDAPKTPAKFNNIRIHCNQSYGQDELHANNMDHRPVPTAAYTG